MTMIHGKGPDTLAFDLLKAVGIGKHADLVYVKPVTMELQPSAPTATGKNSKTARLKVTFGFDPTIFKNPKSVEAFVTGRAHFLMYHAFEPSLLAPDVLEMAEKSNEAPQNTLKDYPELLELWNEFLPKWREAYQRALDSKREASPNV